MVLGMDTLTSEVAISLKCGHTMSKGVVLSIGPFALEDANRNSEHILK